MLAQWITGQEPTKEKLFLWNMIGSAVYAGASLILTYMTIRIAGEVKGGVFGIALTIAQMLVYIAYYEIRNFQVTDIADHYVFPEYHMVKLINCTLMLVISALYVLVKGYDSSKSLIIVGVCVYRMLDGYADLYESEFHRIGRLDLAGKSMTFRTVLSVGVYFLLLIIKKDVMTAVTGAIVSGIVGIYLFDIQIFHYIKGTRISVRASNTKNILLDCFPLFIGMFLWTYLLSAPRIAVDNAMPSEYQSYFQVLFLPISVINLLAGFLIRPRQVALSEMYAKSRMSELLREVRKMLLVLSGFTGICMLGGYLVGIPVLEFLVKCDLKEYRVMFVFLIFSGGINAAAYILYFILVIFRKRRSILMGYGISSLIALLLLTGLTRRLGLWGASLGYFISISALLVFLTLSFAAEERRISKKK